MEERRGAHRILVRKPEGRRPFERPSCRWEGNIKIYIRGLGGGVAWAG